MLWCVDVLNTTRSTRFCINARGYNSYPRWPITFIAIIYNPKADNASGCRGRITTIKGTMPTSTSASNGWNA